MKSLIKILSLILIFSSCTKDFEELNTNHNSPTDVSPQNLLPTVIFNIANSNVSTAYDFGEVISQYGARYEYISKDLYIWNSSSSFWFYSWLQNISDIKAKAKLSGNENYEAIALILESYMIAISTDAYGPVPYSEANKGEEGLYSPKYDSQQEVYNKIFENLESANKIINEEDKVKGDILYNGNMSKWRKFANSLYIRYLVRISNKTDVTSKLQQIVGNPSTYPLFTSNADNATYYYSGSFPNISPVTDGNGREYEYHIVVPSTTIIEQLKATGDPRLDQWFDPKDDVQGNWIGLQPGLPIDKIGEPTDYCRRADEYFYKTNKISSLLMTYSELNFLLAEARMRNLINSESTQHFYNKGVEASFEQWGVEMPTDFLNTSAPFSEANLFTQKWLALYHVNCEAWFDWKRTGKPAFLKAGPGTQNDGKIPKRLIYPTEEQSLNKINYDSAIQSIGGSDNINAKIWWDNF
jgi:hypothetical protein